MITWDDLFINGDLIDVTVTRWQPILHIKPQDLGLSPTPEIEKALNVGFVRLAPKEAFEAINDAARTAQEKILDAHTLPFTMLPGTRFLPNKEKAECQQKLADAEAAFNAAVEGLLQQYDEMKAKQFPIIRAALQDACHSADALENAMRRIEENFPSSQVVRGRYSMKWRLFGITAPVNSSAAESVVEIRDVVTGMVQRLRNDLAERVNRLIELAGRGEKLPTRSVNSASDVLDRLERMNVMGDTVLQDQITTLRGLLSDEASQTVQGLTTVQQALQTDLQAAVAAAEQKLTGVGKRRLLA